MRCVVATTVAVIIILCPGSRSDAVNSASANTFRKFWNMNNAYLRWSATDGMFTPCQWYARDEMTDNGVKVTAWFFVDHTKAWRKSVFRQQQWIFGDDNKMRWRRSDGLTVKKLLLDDGKACGVIEYEEYDSVGEEECREESKGTETCIYGGKRIELLVNSDHKDNVPDECTRFYEERRNGTQDTRNRDVKICGNSTEIPKASPVH
uniref:Putative group i salivary lipocalin n=1 Tax=Rhipicephalus pulchellus TaxID=72859 RepID=L7MBW8_RHIPC